MNVHLHHLIVIWHLATILLVAVFLPGGIISAILADMVVTGLTAVAIFIFSKLRGED